MMAATAVAMAATTTTKSICRLLQPHLLSQHPLARRQRSPYQPRLSSSGRRSRGGRLLWQWIGGRGCVIRSATEEELPSARKTAAAKAAHTRTTGGGKPKPMPSAASKVPPSPSKMDARQLQEEMLRTMRGNVKQHRLGEVSNRCNKCNIAGCGNMNARFGCKLCRIHLCSPECYNAHVFDGAEVCGSCNAVFLEVSKFKQKKSSENKAHRKQPPPPKPNAKPTRAGRVADEYVASGMWMVSTLQHM